MPRPTLKNLAQKLDLSVTTVSRALAGHDDVSKMTRARIIGAANAAGYVPNSAGKSLVTGKTGFIGILMPLSDKPQIDPFFSEFLAGLGDGLHAQERDLFLATVGPHQNEIDVLKRVVEGGRADGVVLTRVFEQDPRVDYLLKQGFPFITHGRTLCVDGAHRWVDTDGARAFNEAFDVLQQHGHKHFALCSINEAMSFKHYREQGLHEAINSLGDNNIALQTVRTPRFDQDARKQAIQRLLSDKHRPTAIIGLTDEIALDVIQIAHQLNIKVPEELSVIGFDNLPASAWSQPRLSTFDQNIRATAFSLATDLIDLLDNPGTCATTNQSTLTSAKFVARASHGPAPGKRQVTCLPPSANL